MAKKPRYITITDDQLAKLVNGCRSEKRENEILNEKFDMIIQDDEATEQFIRLLRDWFDERYDEDIATITKSYNNIVAAQNKNIERISKQIDRISCEHKIFNKEIRDIKHDLKKQSDIMSEYKACKDKCSHLLKEYKKLKHRMNDISKIIKFAAYCGGWADPGDSLAEIRKNFKCKSRYGNNRGYIGDVSCTEPNVFTGVPMITSGR